MVQYRALSTFLGVAFNTHICVFLSHAGYVLEVEGAAVVNARFVVNHSPTTLAQLESEQEEQERREREETALQIDRDLIEQNMYQSTLSVH